MSAVFRIIRPHCLHPVHRCDLLTNYFRHIQQEIVGCLSIFHSYSFQSFIFHVHIFCLHLWKRKSKIITSFEFLIPVCLTIQLLCCYNDVYMAMSLMLKPLLLNIEFKPRIVEKSGVNIKLCSRGLKSHILYWFASFGIFCIKVGADILAVDVEL